MCGRTTGVNKATCPPGDEGARGVDAPSASAQVARRVATLPPPPRPVTPGVTEPAAAVAIVEGTVPNAATTAKMVGVFGGMLGILVLRLIRRFRGGFAEEGPSRGRVLLLTQDQILVTDAGVPTGTIALAGLGKLNVSKSFADPFRRSMRLEGPGGLRIAIEGERRAIETFAAAVQERTAVSAKTVKPFWLLRALLVGILYTFGVFATLVAIPVAADSGIASAVVTSLAGLALIAAGEGSRRLLLR